MLLKGLHALVTIKVVTVFPSAQWINRQSRDTPMRTHNPQDFSNSRSSEYILYLHISNQTCIDLTKVQDWSPKGLFIRIDEFSKYSHSNNSCAIPFARQREHLLTKFLFRLSWEKSNCLELLEGLKSQELNRSVLPGVDLLGVDLPGVEIRS